MAAAVLVGADCRAAATELLYIAAAAACTRLSLLALCGVRAAARWVPRLFMIWPLWAYSRSVTEAAKTWPWRPRAGRLLYCDGRKETVFRARYGHTLAVSRVAVQRTNLAAKEAPWKQGSRSKQWKQGSRSIEKDDVIITASTSAETLVGGLGGSWTFRSRRRQRTVSGPDRRRNTINLRRCVALLLPATDS